jgi:hypothetical protein
MDNAQVLAQNPSLDEQVRSRRAHLRALEAENRPPLGEGCDEKWGLALSGGGLRSAAFCLGLLKALAANKQLLRFDLVSTVAGSGYVAGTIGTLFSRAGSARECLQVEEAIGSSCTHWYEWWLRANGRYLLPRGARDGLRIVTVYLRNLSAVHLELGLVAMLVGVLICALNLLIWTGVYRLTFNYPDDIRTLAGWLPPFFSSIWLLMIIPIFAGAVLVSAYWFTHWVLRSRGMSMCVGTVLAAAILAMSLCFRQLTLDPEYRQLFPWGMEIRSLLTIAGALAALASFCGMLVSVAVCFFAERKAASDPQIARRELRDHAEILARHRLSNWLYVALQLGLAIAALGIVDRVAWYVAFEGRGFPEVTLLLLITAAIARPLLPLASQLVPGAKSSGWLVLIGGALGYGLMLLLLVWWVSLIQQASLGLIFGQEGEFEIEGAAYALLIIFVPTVAYVVATGRDLSFLNQSSLHSLFSARIARAFLGAANRERFPREKGAAHGPLTPVAPHRSMEESPVPVDKLHVNDDIKFRDYLPQRNGGPVHLINVCLNQSRAPAGKLLNMDRRGVLLTVASGQIRRMANRPWQRLERDALSGSWKLSHWLAISGAAIASGLGNMHRGGIAALTTFAGARLGFWWTPVRDGERRSWGPRSFFGFGKTLAILKEAFGSFDGVEAKSFFLTDGGHFENTGAYALLSERAEVIVLADCSADPEFRFRDLETLVRMARIDLQAEVLFQRPKRPVPPNCFPGYEMFGSLNDIASPTGRACIAVARIKYRDEGDRQGIMFVVKPSLFAGLPLDLVQFKRENPEFPQESTADPFFSEAQWEGYLQLGRFQGEQLCPALRRTSIKNLVEFCFEDDECSPLERPHESSSAPTARLRAESRLPSRFGPMTKTVGTTIGLGAVAALGVSTWQGIESAREIYLEEVAQQHALLKDLTQKWGHLRAKGQAASTSAEESYQEPVASLAAALIHAADTLCPGDDAHWFQSSQLARRIHRDAIEQCESLPERFPLPLACSTLMQTFEKGGDPVVPRCLRWGGDLRNFGYGDRRRPVYWGFVYHASARLPQMHPCHRSRAQRTDKGGSQLPGRDEQPLSDEIFQCSKLPYFLVVAPGAVSKLQVGEDAADRLTHHFAPRGGAKR